ncbi:alpha/beta hydrolase [Bacillales bacterium AN1005]
MKKAGRLLKMLGKVLLILLGILVLVVVSMTLYGKWKSTQPLLDEGYSDVYKTESPLEQKYIKMGTYDVSTIEYDSNDDEGVQTKVWYPTELTNTDHTYPLIVIANASDMSASRYEPFFKHLATWGFVVVGNEDRMSSSGKFNAESLDLMLELNSNADNIFYGKIDINNIGIAGYSQGGVGAINAVTAQENGHYYKTIFTGSAANFELSKALGWNYDVSKITIPYFMTAGTLKNDTGEDNGIGVAPLSSLIKNYDLITNDVLKVGARAVNADHEDMLVHSDGYLTAWMMYHLQGDEEAGKAFLGKNAEILNNANWQDVQISK